MESSKLVVYAALAGNLAIAASKLVAFALTGSAAILTEAIHSFVDTGNQGLMLLGLARAKRAPDESHPFGYGMEIYFWSFVVALAIFALGGAVSIWEGAEKIHSPQAIGRPWVNFLVIGVAAVFEGSSFAVALREFNRMRQSRTLLASIHRSKDPSVFVVLLEDGAALAGLVVALAGVAASVFLGWAWADGAASCAIGVLLIAVAAVLANETRSLLTGEGASPQVVDPIRRLLDQDERVVGRPAIRSLHLGPEDILVGITLALRGDLSRDGMEQAVRDLSARVREVDERIRHVFLQPCEGAGPGRPAPSQAQK